MKSRGSNSALHHHHCCPARGAPHVCLQVCYLSRGTTDQQFLESLDALYKGKHQYYGNIGGKKRSVDRFSILHFAGEVTYCVDGFIEKNNDTLYTVRPCCPLSLRLLRLRPDACAPSGIAGQGWLCSHLVRRCFRLIRFAGPGGAHG